MPPVFLIRKRIILCGLAAAGAFSPETAKTPAEAGLFNPNGLSMYRYHDGTGNHMQN